MSNECLLVTGMHRSGTSMLTRVINLLGISISDELVEPGADNVTGFWEDKKIVDIDEKILQSVGSHHLDASFLPTDWYHQAVVRILAKSISDLMTAELSKADHMWMLKDPRIARLLPVYNEILSSLNVKSKMVIALRHPMEVAQSLLKRNGIPLEIGMRLWLQYHLECEKNSRHMDRVYVYYPYLLSDWQTQVERISQQLHIEWPETYDSIADSVRDFIQPNLRHHANGGDFDNDMPPEIRAFFNHLCEVAEDTAEVNTELSDSIREQQLATYYPPVTCSTNQKRVCLVTSDIVGPVNNGGIGTAFYHMAQHLKQENYHVTILYVSGVYAEKMTVNYWQEFYRKQGIEFIPLTASSNIALKYVSAQQSTNYQVYLWLKQHFFDMVFFHEWRGNGYYPVLAKSLNLAFSNTSFVVVTHSPFIWHTRFNCQGLGDADVLEIDYMERESVRLADSVVSPSHYLIDWCKSEHWQFPERTQVIQNITEDENDADESFEPYQQLTQADDIHEIVFFGRLEIRKGIKLFIEALGRLPIGYLENKTICFLGKNSQIHAKASTEFIQEYCAKHLDLSANIRIICKVHYSSAEAQSYLKEEGKLAVIASLCENSPYTVKEVIHRRVPFISTNTGGIAELIHEDDRATVLYDATPQALADKLAFVLSNGITTARPSVTNAQVKQQWTDFCQELLDYQTQQAKAASAVVHDKDRPLVSVCITHFERPHYLETALASIAKQTYPWKEVIVIDDGSKKQQSVDYLNHLEQAFASQDGWRLVRQENKYLGAARNRGFHEAKGTYILFMDDDNIALPEEIETLVDIAETHKADITIPGRYFFKANQEIMAHGVLRMGWMPIGPALQAAMFKNVIGDNNALFRRDMLEELGGYTEDYGIGFEDYELFIKAILADKKIIPVPEPLYFYRKDDDHEINNSMINNTSYIANRQRVMRVFREKYPELSTVFDRLVTVL